MNATTRDTGGLGLGGPSDQSAIRTTDQDDAEPGSQAGWPRKQEPGATAGHPDAAAKTRRGDTTAESERGISETERRAGTPDPRATTDWSHGEGEPGSTG
jgi:hypothetical protein